MAVELLTFDPDGDLLLVLTEVLDGEDMKDNEKKAGGAVEQMQDEIPGDHFSPGMTVSYMDNGIPPAEVDPPRRREIHMLVSSKHLMLASPVFKAMLQHRNFREGDILRSSGHARVELPDDDPTALKILLDIIHGRVRQVPRQVILKTMTDLSVLVDKYRMLEIVELYVEIWMGTLKNSVPVFFTVDLLPWLSISWVFGLAEIFRQMTRIAMRGSTDKFGAHEEYLPIPQHIFGAISDARRKGIQDAIAVVEYTIMKYQGPTQHCRSTYSTHRAKKNVACDGLILGSLLKSASANGLWPPPPHPYTGLTFSGVMSRARSLDITALCDDSIHTFSVGQPAPSHGVKQSICSQMDSLEIVMNGLDLKTFKEPSKEDGPAGGWMRFSPDRPASAGTLFVCPILYPIPIIPTMGYQAFEIILGEVAANVEEYSMVDLKPRRSTKSMDGGLTGR